MGSVAELFDNSVILRQEEDLNVARLALKLEAKGIQDLSDCLDERFSQAISLLFKAKGRVIISGMGKSGHVGAKIAATMASTGTPASFVHPAEASHGDLGMITTNDVVICLSNSGGTVELSDLIHYTRRSSIPLIAIVAKENSILGRAADVCLVIPPVEEACPNGLAPTTSTTVMMALGDALSVALMKRKGFSADDFHQFHPGGKLGSRFLTVSDVMHKDRELPLVCEDMQMAQVMIEITAKSFGCTGVVDKKGNLVGVITDGDIRRHMCDDFLRYKASDVMSHNPVVADEKQLAIQALPVIQNKKITSIFVVNLSVSATKPVGLLHIHDCLRAGII